MPSPFPGMDPYLEHPARWADVHHSMISTIRRMLTERLRPRYFVTVEERVYISNEEDTGRSVIVPDLRVTRRPGRVRPAVPAVATATVVEPIELELLDDEIHEARLEVLDSEYRQVTAVIEVVSPTHKVWGAAGRESYARKRAEVSASPAHFVEIDLLRAGTPMYAKEMFSPHEYLVHVSRVSRPKRRHQFWPIRLDQRLPVVFVPLRGGDADVELDLQAALDATYDEAGYDLVVDYRRDPVPPLAEEWAEWARAIARGAVPPTA